MTKSDLELFKEALAEGLSIRFQNEIDSCQEEIIISERHERAMRTIFNGAQVRPIIWPSARAKIAAVIVAATMILASCAAVYIEEIRGFIETVYENYISIGFENPDESPRQIEEVYELTYIPLGYAEIDHIQTNLHNIYTFKSADGGTIRFDQQILNTIDSFDSEHSEFDFIYISEMKIYYVFYSEYYNYLWNDGKYAMTINSTEELSYTELETIISGIKIKN